MQHKEWQEQIPFYVAQTLSSDEIRLFEAHLLNCESCQQETDDWRGIASAVWTTLIRKSSENSLLRAKRQWVRMPK